MMSKNQFENTFNIYLFTGQEKDESFSQLSEFLAFLKYNKVHLPYKFSYVSSGTDALIPDLTLNENILMDFSPDSLTASKQFQFQEFLKENPNRHLERLYQEITMPHELPAHTDTQMKKLSGLIKSLIFEGQFIFLEEPEIHLETESVKLFIDALKEHITRHKKNVFIFSRNIQLWSPHADNLVCREKDYTFSTKKMTSIKAWNHPQKWRYRRGKLSIVENNPLSFKKFRPVAQKLTWIKSAA
jgi:ABC-type transporter Mla maintaining outer membrane lipid asymmetry ATPase subunit MlaF